MEGMPPPPLPPPPPPPPPPPTQCYPLYSLYSLYSFYRLYSPPAGFATHDAVRQAIGAVFFRRSRLFFREAAFFSDGEGCEWRVQRATVGSEWGYNGENSFSALSPFAGSRKGFSPHIPASRLFVYFHTSKATIPPNQTAAIKNIRK